MSPRFVTSSSAEMSANIASNGGESLTMSLFWGSTDGGINESIDSNDSSLWDYRVDLNGSYSTGTVSHLVDGLDMNGTYFYRWMASNSVNPNAWSEASDTGMLAWWSFDEIDQTFSMDRVGNRKASFVGISESDRVFGRNGNGLRFGGAGEHLVCRNFKGIPADKPVFEHLGEYFENEVQFSVGVIMEMETFRIGNYNGKFWFESRRWSS